MRTGGSRPCSSISATPEEGDTTTPRAWQYQGQPTDTVRQCQGERQAPVLLLTTRRRSEPL